MAVYRFFPTKTATLYSYYPDKNTGLDEITDLSLYHSIDDTYEVSRTLVKFDQDEIQELFRANNIISGSISASLNDIQYSAYLKLSLANASEIPLEYNIVTYPISASWNMGTGRLANNPETTDGVSWKWMNTLSGSLWYTPLGAYNPIQVGLNDYIYPSSSYKSGSNGGGTWWDHFNWATGTVGFATSQSFTHSDSKDIELNITQQVKSWLGGLYNNEGSIIKHKLEFISGSSYETKYFTSNTHTIYPPCLEIRWVDVAYNPNTGSVITGSNVVVNIANNKGEYQQDSVQRFVVNVRDKYPVRLFQTSSVYLNNKTLPTSSYWAIKDYNTEEMIIDYDTLYTRISATDKNYFDVYMSGLEPERHYKILVKVILNGETIVFDNNNIFKVVR